MDVPQSYGYDSVSVAVDEATEEEIREFFSNANYVEPTTALIHQDGDTETVGAICVTFPAESTLRVRRINKFEDTTGLELEKIRFAKNRIRFI